MKAKLLLLLIATISLIQAFGQIPLDCRNSCSYFGETIDEQTYGFTSDREAQEALQNIVKHTGLPINFTLMAGNVPNAAAVIKCDQNTKDCSRYIIYNQNFMLRVKQTTRTDWAAVSILAHEIGHHLSGHTLLNGGSRPALELEADKFSGFVLYNMGATLEEAQIAINTFVGESQSTTHPGRSARIAAITNGWIQASEIRPSSDSKANERAESVASNNSTSNSTINTSRGIFWRHDGAKNQYALLVDGQSIATRCERAYSDNDYIVYDKEEKKTYLLENFKNLTDNRLRPGKLLGNGWSIFWRHDGPNKKFALYVDGQSIAARCENAYSGNDYIVYDKETRKTYFLENFKSLTDNRLRSGALLSSNASIYWRHNGANNTYALYVNGQSIAARCEMSYVVDDYIIYDPKTTTTYLLENFRNQKDNRLRTGKILSTGPSIYWRFDRVANSYSLYINGQSIASRCQASYSGDDYIVYDPTAQKRYILENFRNLGDNQLRKGRELK